jgi:vitamin B12 transporter
MKQLSLHIIFMLVAIQVFAQADSVKSLPDVMVQAKLKKYASSINSVKIDSTVLHQNINLTLNEIVQQNSGAFVRAYGAGGLGVASIRGSSASQVNLMWNGLPINQYSNSLADLSLTPSFLFDEVQVHMGGNASAWQSGDVGGSIMLLNKPSFEKNISARVIGTIGSFGLKQTNASLSLSNQRFFWRTKFHKLNIENNFPFLNPLSATKEYIKLKNARAAQIAMQQELAYKISNTQSIDAVIWIQQTERQLAPTMLQVESREAQSDEHVRIKIEHQLRQNKFQWYNRVGLADEYLLYKNPNLMISDVYRTKYINAESEIHVKVNKPLMFFGSVGGNAAQLDADNYYPSKPKQNRIFGRLSAKFTKEKYGATAGLKIENVDGKNVPLVYNATAYYLANEKIKITANAQRNYRLPSFNDLYWYAGGDKNLKPEQGHSAELAAQYCTTLFDMHVGTYYRNTTNWITWQPTATGMWQAKNLSQVQSTGAEFKANFHKEINSKIAMKIAMRYDFCKAVIDGTATTINYGKQLLYVPMHKSSADFSFTGKQWRVNYGILYLGKRFTSADNLDFLPNNWVQNINASAYFTAFQQKIAINGSINNVFAQQYQVMLGRPMPLRNYVLSLSLDLTKSNTKNTTK